MVGGFQEQKSSWEFDSKDGMNLQHSGCLVDSRQRSTKNIHVSSYDTINPSP